MELQNKPTESLYVHEWLSIVVIAGILFSIGLVSLLSLDSPQEKTDNIAFVIKSPIVSISIDGAVEKPGIYQVDKQVSILDAIQLALPFGDADLSREELNKPIGRKRKIHVAYKKNKLARIPTSN